MAKVLNQNLFTGVLYGSENAGASLTLQSTLSATQGIVKIVGTSLDLFIGGTTGRFIHANTALRTYTFPDIDGTFLTDSIYTGNNQIVYSTGANTYTLLNSVSASLLSTSSLGVPTWITGTNGQFLQMSGGLPIFAPLPSGIGTTVPSVGNTLPIYQFPGPSQTLEPLTTISNMVLTSPSGVPSWNLISASYLAAVGNVPLSFGLLGQKLKSNGDGTFYWANDLGVINSGVQNFVSYYNITGAEISGSAFMAVDESTNSLALHDYGKLRLYEPIFNGASYVELRPPTVMGASISFSLPGADGSPGDFMKTDGLGNLSFITYDKGEVLTGLVNQLAYYAANDKKVSPIATTSNRVLLSPLGLPTWGLVKAPYLSGAGNIPLVNGAASDVLTAVGDGTFLWQSVIFPPFTKQGDVSIPSGVNSVTVLFSTPFLTPPNVILAQWSHEGLSSPVSLPTISVRIKNAEGFVLEFSTTTTKVYTLYWEAVVDGDTALGANLYFVGGEHASLSADLQVMPFDRDTVIATPVSLSSARGYTMSTASSLEAFIYGGTIGILPSTIITTCSYASNTLTDQIGVLTVPRSGGAGVGTRTIGYVCGGQALTSIDKVVHSTLTVTALPASLISAANKRGSALSNIEGYVVHSDGSSTVDILNFTTEVVTASPVNFGTPSIEVGCNDNVNNIGYFGSSTGSLYSYDFSTDTITNLGVSTTSITGLSGAGNSLLNGYFSGASAIDRFSFATATSVAVNALSFSGALGASISTFQTSGLL
jgi:hypothetical protein